jgi:NAD(P)-dependent dehydrogenase (short-subunit alcohol dehydrogenase family)
MPSGHGPEKSALITGGGTGIGRAAAIALAAEGYAITVAGRTAGTLEQTVKLIEDAGGTATYVIADVHDEDAVRHAVEVAAGGSADGGPGEGGRLDVAVNSAGVDGTLSCTSTSWPPTRWAVSPNRRRLPTRSFGWPPASPVTSPAWHYPWTGATSRADPCRQGPRAASRRTIT